MANRVLILGGGFGGVAAARRLRDLLPAGDEIVLADRGTHFMMGFRKIAAIVGRAPLEDGMRPLVALERFGIRVLQGEINTIEPGARAAEIDGERIEADAMLVALGAETVPAAIPGLVEHGIDVWSGAGVARAAEALAAIDKGKVVIGIFGVPYKCPPAPFELALLAQEATTARGARIAYEVFSPLPSSLPVVGPAGCEAIEGRLTGMFIDFRRNTKATRVEPGSVVTDQGDIAFDLLFAIPPHRVPPVITQAGLAPEGGWIKADPRTLATSHDGVWAVGDCIALQMAGNKPMPKAGEFAQREGTVAAEHIAAGLLGGSSEAEFWGEGRCFLETGDGEAMIVQGRFLIEPEPEVELTPPSAANLDEKHRFERERLDAWFGPE